MEKFDKLSRYADYFSFVDYFFVHILRNQFPSVIGKYFPPPPHHPVYRLVIGRNEFWTEIYKARRTIQLK
jgi:hypothetical protein